MLEKGSVTGLQIELIDMNREFLRLVTDPAVRSLPNLLGMTGTLLRELQNLTPDQLDTVASTPILLAEFTPFPGLAAMGEVADTPPLPCGLAPIWQNEAEGFANRLLACIWQVAKHDNLLTAFCIGVDPDCHRRLANLSFSTINQSSAYSLRCLRVRLADHSGFWTDLLSHVRHGTVEQQTASRLAIIPLCVAHSGFPVSTPHRPRYF